MRFLLLLTTLFIALYADITLEFLKSKPESIERDFYIWQFLKQKGISPQEIEEAYSLSHFKNSYIYKQYMAVTKNEDAKKLDMCKGLRGDRLLSVSPWCADVGLTYDRAFILPKELQRELAKKLKTQNPKKAEFLLFLSNGANTKDIVRVYPAIFNKIFVNSSEDIRRSKLDLDLNKTLIDRLPRDAEFLDLVKIVVQNSYPRLQKSLLNASAKGGGGSDIQFYLGINAINHGRIDKAKEYFKSALNIASYKKDKNKALFWLYLTENNKTRLEQICDNEGFDFYSLNAYELLGKKRECFEIETDISPNVKNRKYNIKDPFLWTELKLKRDKNITLSNIEPLFTIETLPHYSFLKRAIDGYRSEHFILPFRDAFGVYEPKRQALLYAIAKQESLFIPSAISRSFALGMMQIMPFNIEAIAKQRGESTKLEDMFDYKLNLIYSNSFVERLVERFKYPLFVAYAYNGGDDFTSKMLKKGIFKNGRFEPYLSIEMVPITESREYGKQVLANYVIYSELLGVPTSMMEQIEEIKRGPLGGS